MRPVVLLRNLCGKSTVTLMKRSTVLLAWAVGLTLLISGCSGGASGVSAEQQLAEAQTKIEHAEAITISLTSADVPSNVDGVQAATGTAVMDGDLIKFEGEFQGKVSGVAAKVAILAIGDDTYMKLFTPDYEPVVLSTLGVPNPAGFFLPETGLASLLASTTDLNVGEQVREGDDVLTEITGKLSGDKVNALLNLGEADQSFDVTYGLTEDNELRTVVLSGEFWKGTVSSYTMLLTDYGVVVPIEVPAKQ